MGFLASAPAPLNFWCPASSREEMTSLWGSHEGGALVLSHSRTQIFTACCSKSKDGRLDQQPWAAAAAAAAAGKEDREVRQSFPGWLIRERYLWEKWEENGYLFGTYCVPIPTLKFSHVICLNFHNKFMRVDAAFSITWVQETKMSLLPGNTSYCVTGLQSELRLLWHPSLCFSLIPCRLSKNCRSMLLMS